MLTLTATECRMIEENRSLIRYEISTGYAEIPDVADTSELDAKRELIADALNMVIVRGNLEKMADTLANRRNGL